MAEYNTRPTRRGNNASEHAAAMTFAPSAPPDATMGQSGNWIAPRYLSLEMLGGSTVAQPCLELESAPFVAAGSGGDLLDAQSNASLWASRKHARVTSIHVHTCTAKGCHISFPTSNKLEQHASESGHKAFLCTCGKGYTRLFPLKRHFKEAVEPRKYKCPCCDCPAFSRLPHVEKHLRSSHKVTQKTTIDALLRSQQDASRSGASHHKGTGVVTTVNGTTIPTASFVSSPFPLQPLTGPPLFPSYDGFSANMPGPFAVPAAGPAAALDALIPAPAGMFNAGMAEPMAMPAAEAASVSAGDELDWLDGVAWTDVTAFGF